MNLPSLIDVAKYNTFWESNLPKWIEEIITKKLEAGLIPLTQDFFNIYNHPDSGYMIRLIPVGNETLAVNVKDWEKMTDFPLSMFSSTAYNAYAVHLHQQFLVSLINYSFGFKALHPKYLYFDSRALYDTIHRMCTVDGIHIDLVPYLEKGYKLSETRFLKKKHCDTIRIVLDHYNYPEPYFKKILIYCIKNKVWPTFDMFVKFVVYPLTKVRIIKKETHDALGISKDSDRGVMYENAEIRICEVTHPYKEISNLNIWSLSEDTMDYTEAQGLVAFCMKGIR
tara:strand:- start:1633 stop:2478 length:846 start_codon:yes stop_codon:yes gene_type:complete